MSVRSFSTLAISAKPAAGEPALLSFDDARTLFHEFGHALHGLLSNVTYPLLAGTAVPSDFVELPSQLYEHWLEVPEILQKYARHARTGEPMPKPLLDRLLATRTYGQGFATVEYTACALVDLDLHGLPDAAGLDVTEFERKDSKRIQMPAEIVMCYRLPHFQHLFSGLWLCGGGDSTCGSIVRKASEPFRLVARARMVMPTMTRR